MKSNYSKQLLLGMLVVAGMALSLAAEKPPRPQGWVSDFAGVISEDARQKITSISGELEKKTGAEVAVVTVQDLGGETVENYAVDLFKEWGIGKKGKDNGVLLIAAINDRKVRIEVGYGLEGILPDGKTGAILDRYVLPAFRRGNYADGLVLGNRAIAEIIAKDSGVALSGEPLPAPRARSVSEKIQLLIFSITMIIGIIGTFLPRSGIRRYNGRGRFGGGFGGGGSSGGFGGFGGGFSGGGGASRGW